MDKVKLGIVGIGNMGRSHIDNIFKGKVPNTELTAICDVDDEKLNWIDQFNKPVQKFSDVEKMIESGVIDAILIATPHYLHPILAIKSLNAGLHTLIEKPAGVFTKAVREMNEVAAKTDKVFGIMYNQRTNPNYQKVKQIFESGELGELKRVIWIITSWYRPQAYHDSSSWRSTWKDEGGGVLINQDPHQLDLLQWMVGMPKRIRSFCYFGKFYNIEVEDDVTAYMEYPNGATGLFVSTTGEKPGTNRLEVSGDRGKIVIEEGKFTFHKTEMSEREFNRTNITPFGGDGMPLEKIEYSFTRKSTSHAGILKNFSNAILNGEKLLAPGVEGIKGLSISNAIHLSSWTDNWVDPNNIDEDLFKKILDEKIASSTIVKEQNKGTVSDLSDTY